MYHKHVHQQIYYGRKFSWLKEAGHRILVIIFEFCLSSYFPRIVNAFERSQSLWLFLNKLSSLRSNFESKVSGKLLNFQRLNVHERKCNEQTEAAVVMTIFWKCCSVIPGDFTNIKIDFKNHSLIFIQFLKNYNLNLPSGWVTLAIRLQTLKASAVISSTLECRLKNVHLHPDTSTWDYFQP